MGFRHWVASSGLKVLVSASFVPASHNVQRPLEADDPPPRSRPALGRGLILVSRSDRIEQQAVTADRALKAIGLSSPQVSPDGASVAFVQSVLRLSHKTRATSIWSVPSRGGKLRRLTHGPDDDQPCWSPDGAALAFTRKLQPDQPPQVFLLPADGGEAVQLGKLEVAPGQLRYLPSGRRLSFVAAEADDRRARERKEKGDDARRLIADDKPVRLWTLSLASGRAKAVSPANVSVGEYDWLPDGNRVAVIYADEPNADAMMFRARLGLLTTADGTIRPLGIKLCHHVHGVRVSPDGRHVAVLGSVTDTPSGGMVWITDLQSGQSFCLTPELTGTAENLEWLPDSSGLLLQIGEGFQTPLTMARLAEPGKLAPVCQERPGALNGLTLSPDGRRVTLICEGPDQPPELWGCDLDTPQATRLTRVNAEAAELAVGTSRVIRWASFDGLEIEGELILPRSYRKGRTYPTILVVHGGPAGRFRQGYNLLPLQVLAAQGYVVLAPNPRGSTGRGEEFVRGNLADWGGGDFRDLMAGVDHLITEGIADPKRLGVWGASYGGFMTAWIVSQTDRFRAAICQCGLSNLVSFAGTTDIPGFMQLYFGISPYENPDLPRAHSAMTFIQQAKTPTLFLHGEQDVRVPISQSYEMYWGLRHVGVETEFVIYPREGHGIAETPHQRDLYRRAVDWFKRHLR
jgi:dipeptidyl aminopeptidase/acylaminoacyl peptidase